MHSLSESMIPWKQFYVDENKFEKSTLCMRSNDISYVLLKSLIVEKGILFMTV